MGKLVTFCNAKTVFITRGRQRLSVCQVKTITNTTGNIITDISQEILEEHYKVIKKTINLLQDNDSIFPKSVKMIRLRMSGTGQSV